MKFGFLLFALSMILQSFSQILEKKGMSQLGIMGSFGQYFSMGTISRMIANHYLMAGIFLSVLGMVTWLGALTNFKLSYLYSLGALTYLVVAGLSWWLLGESISTIRWIGMAVIVAGCVMLNF